MAQAGCFTDFAINPAPRHYAVIRASVEADARTCHHARMYPAVHSNSHSRHRRIFLLFAAVLLSIPLHSGAIRQQAPQPRVKAADLAKRIHLQVNEQRKKHGLTVLAWDDALTRIALKHSRDMATRDYLGHNSPEGVGFTQRYRRDGYSCEIQTGNQVHAGAENIALSRLYNSTTTENGVTYYNWNSVQEIAQKTVDGWMNSAGHRENILTPYWRQEGIGIMIGPGNQIYITQNFC